MEAAYRLEVATIPCERSFPRINEALVSIAGRTRDGRQRIICEWGGMATRPFRAFPGAPEQRSAKYGLYSETVVSAYVFQGDPKGRTKRDRMTLRYETDDLGQVPTDYLYFSDDRMRVFDVEETVIDHPIPNFFFADYISGAQMGSPERFPRGYYQRIWQCYNPNLAGPPFWGYRGPDEDDLIVIEEYWKVRMRDVQQSGCDIDSPAEGSALEIREAWINRARRNLQEELRGRNAEDFAQSIDKYLKEQREAGRPFVDLGVRPHEYKQA